MFKKSFLFKRSIILPYISCTYNVHLLGPKVQGPFYAPIESEKKDKKTAIIANNQIVTNNNQQKQWTKKSRKVNSKKNTI
ncbi:hypothetical protein ACIXMS_13670 [Bacteroides fragilis]|jgi:hypothetical protein|uniref:hypothetical protein n=1 Tax=Bacteroides fragilis TaxID=817 RepID=UPI0005164B92|nr:hypothetical protein [Bacteroides fragilis]